MIALVGICNYSSVMDSALKGDVGMRSFLPFLSIPFLVFFPYTLAAVNDPSREESHIQAINRIYELWDGVDSAGHVKACTALVVNCRKCFTSNRKAMGLEVSPGIPWRIQLTGEERCN